MNILSNVAQYLSFYCPHGHISWQNILFPRFNPFVVTFFAILANIFSKSVFVPTAIILSSSLYNLNIFFILFTVEVWLLFIAIIFTDRLFVNFDTDDEFGSNDEKLWLRGRRQFLLVNRY
ncbi:hypothetical protein BDF21DRAFT_398835 [Thamnidium elegans]|nr:hypothetical protein BDF21DRAFT_398835 [Thamnidium elegans]